MSARLVLLVAAIGGLALLTTLALMDVGYFGILKPHFLSWGAGQVFADLVIALTLACIWMVKDAREQGISAWPFVAITLLMGSFGPLAYLVMRELRSTARRPVSA
jgi:hypothetical protein